MYSFLFTLLVSFTAIGTFAQSAVVDSSFRSEAIERAITLYHQETDQESPLYRGPEHTGYPARMAGSPYFGFNNWQKGTVKYDGVWYSDVNMIYDQVQDKLVIQHFNGIYQIELINDKVQQFTLGGHTFINIKERAGLILPKTGFYDLLVSGTVTLLAKTEKSIEDFIEGNEARQRIKAKTTYYAVKDQVSHGVANKRSLLDVFGDKKKEVQQYLRKNKIKFRRKSEQAMIQATEYYNQLTR